MDDVLNSTSGYDTTTDSECSEIQNQIMCMITRISDLEVKTKTQQKIITDLQCQLSKKNNTIEGTDDITNDIKRKEKKIRINVNKDQGTMTCVYGLISCCKSFDELFESKSIEYNNDFSTAGVQKIISNYEKEPTITESGDNICIRYYVYYGSTSCSFFVIFRKDWFEFEFDNKTFESSTTDQKIDMLTLKIKQLEQEYPKVVYFKKKDVPSNIVTFEDRKHHIHNNFKIGYSVCYYSKPDYYSSSKLCEKQEEEDGKSIFYASRCKEFLEYSDLQLHQYIEQNDSSNIQIPIQNQHIHTYSRYEISKNKLFVNLLLEEEKTFEEFKSDNYLCNINIVGRYESRTFVIEINNITSKVIRTFYSKLIVKEKKIYLCKQKGYKEVKRKSALINKLPKRSESIDYVYNIEDKRVYTSIQKVFSTNYRLIYDNKDPHNGSYYTPVVCFREYLHKV